jgi:hypothetical protein
LGACGSPSSAAAAAVVEVVVEVAGREGRQERRGCGMREMGLGLGRMQCYIPRKHDVNHWIDDRWLQMIGLFGPTWASLFIVFFFFFPFYCTIVK